MSAVVHNPVEENRRDDDEDVKLPRLPQELPPPDPEPDDELRELVKPVKTLECFLTT